MADVLAQAAVARREKGFNGPKATEAALLDALGRSYLGLDLADRAELAFRKAVSLRESLLGSDHPDTLTSRSGLADTFSYTFQDAQALALFEVVF